MLNVRDKMERLVDEIFDTGRTFYGQPLSSGLRKLVNIQGGATQGTIYVPFWFPVLQYGRGPRRKTKTEWKNFRGVQMSKFQLAIYHWLDKKNMFESKTEKGRINEAKGLAWYINKHGNKHYRDGRYIDIYETLVNEFVEGLRQEIKEEAIKVTSDLIKLRI